MFYKTDDEPSVLQNFEWEYAIMKISVCSLMESHSTTNIFDERFFWKASVIL